MGGVDRRGASPGGRREARPILVALLAAIPLLSACGAESGAQPGAAWVDTGDLQIRHARLGQPALPDRAAAYMEIRNPGDETVRIVSATMDGAAEVSLHESSTAGGSMRMTPVDTLRIDAGSKTVLEPGGIHLMLTGLEARPMVGDTLRITLTSADGASRTVRVPVVPLTDVGG